MKHPKSIKSYKSHQYRKKNCTGTLILIKIKCLCIFELFRLALELTGFSIVCNSVLQINQPSSSKKLSVLVFLRTGEISCTSRQFFWLCDIWYMLFAMFIIFRLVLKFMHSIIKKIIHNTIEDGQKQQSI